MNALNDVYTDFPDEYYELSNALQLHQLAVGAVLLQQLRVVAALNNTAFLQNQNLVGVLDGTQAVGDDERGAAGHQFLEGVLHQASICD